MNNLQYWGLRSVPARTDQIIFTTVCFMYFNRIVSSRKQSKQVFVFLRKIDTKQEMFFDDIETWVLPTHTFTVSSSQWVHLAVHKHTSLCKVSRQHLFRFYEWKNRHRWLVLRVQHLFIYSFSVEHLREMKTQQVCPLGRPPAPSARCVLSSGNRFL